MAKVELNEEMLDEVMGGISYEPVTKRIGADRSCMIYHYDNKEDFVNYVLANYKKYALSERNQELIKGMLAAGIIHK